MQVSNLGNNSAWKRSGVNLSGKDVAFMAKHNVGVTLADTEERLMEVIDDTILNYPAEEDLLFMVDPDMLPDLKRKRCLESFGEESKRLKTCIDDEKAFSAASAKAFNVGVKQPLKCDYMAARKERRLIEERGVVRSVYEKTNTSEFANVGQKSRSEV